MATVSGGKSQDSTNRKHCEKKKKPEAIITTHGMEFGETTPLKRKQEEVIFETLTSKYKILGSKRKELLKGQAAAAAAAATSSSISPHNQSAALNSPTDNPTFRANALTLAKVLDELKDAQLVKSIEEAKTLVNVELSPEMQDFAEVAMYAFLLKSQSIVIGLSARQELARLTQVYTSVDQSVRLPKDELKFVLACDNLLLAENDKERHDFGEVVKGHLIAWKRLWGTQTETDLADASRNMISALETATRDISTLMEQNNIYLGR